jgi:integrase/recombinase XerD
MSGFPCLARSVSGLGEVRYPLGDRLVDRYLEFLAARARPNTLRAVAFDLEAFFTVLAEGLWIYAGLLAGVAVLQTCVGGS